MSAEVVDQLHAAVMEFVGTYDERIRADNPEAPWILRRAFPHEICDTSGCRPTGPWLRVEFRGGGLLRRVPEGVA